ncbi:SGNH/GDSL hydrolase family protein [Ciceribacter ferrooxidans]|uniref:SGNH hydrolase-type esterase domain-containing protein n=1 Tax=Ciceribacter ferrooxidans TaxID=2509717 RepID=A0A4Q2SXB7_9HYPH|nr:SGNH/GDSL hydrolase family protein [Ciceribacter ferrooxidans]RYC10081.1 hypothetical protein EUU22_18580 [Ciceribacter ferrooxidans]
MAVLTKAAESVFAPYNIDGTARQIVPGDAAVWGTEIETVLDDGIGAANDRIDAIESEISVIDGRIDAIESIATSGAQWKQPVAVSTTANITLSGEQTIDGITTSASRVLVKNNTTASQNGIWVTGSGAWTRATDADSAAEILGMAVYVTGGTANGGKQFICTTPATIVVGTTALTFQQISDQSALNANLSSVTNTVSNFSAHANLFRNGNLANDGDGVKLFSPDAGIYSAYSARFNKCDSQVIADLGCTTAIYVPASLGGNGNLVIQEVNLVGGYILVSMLVHSSAVNWTFGNANGLQVYARYSDGTNVTIMSSNGTLTHTDLGSNTRRYTGTIALNAAKTCVRIDAGLNDAGTRTANFYITGFWASWSLAQITLNQTAYPNWTASVPDVQSLQKESADNTSRLARLVFDALSTDIANPLWSVIVTLIGDSITWGLGTSDAGVSEPRAHSLSDPRDVLTSSSWANKLGRWLGYKVCNQENFSNPAPGVRQYRQSHLIAPWDNPNVTVNLSTGAPKPKTSTAASGGKLYRYTSVPPSNEMQFTFFGDEITVWFTTIGDDPSATFTVYVDGSAVATVSHYGVPAAYSQSYMISAALGKHVVRVVNNSATQNLRIEALEHNRICRVVNQGIIGTMSTEWVPTGTLLADGLTADSNHVVIQLGTNDRGHTTQPRAPQQIIDSLTTIITWIGENRPNANIALMAPPQAIGTSEEGGGGTYYYSTAEVSQAIAMVARRLGLPFLDNYAMTAQLGINGDTFLSDNLHPNDFGHSEMFKSIVRFIS